MRKFLFPFFCCLIFASSAWAQVQSVLTWNDCLKEASENHPDLVVAHEDIVQSKALKKVATAGYLPDISANLTATTSNSSDTGSGRSFSYGVTGSQLIFDGLKTPNDIQAAKQDIDAARFGFKFTSSQVRLRLREAFINLLKAQELINLTEEIYQLRKGNLELITLRYESGTEHKGALLSAKANVSQAAFEINSAKRSLKEAQRQLTKELGRKVLSSIGVQGSFDPVFDNKVPEFEIIAQNNPSLLKITSQKNAAAFDIKSKRADFWPSVVLSGDAGKSDDTWLPKESETSAGVSVSVPLFAGGSNAARLALARSVYRQLEQQERSTRDAIILELQQSWDHFANSVERVLVQKDFLQATEERAKIAQAQYSVGLISFDNWTIIEDDLVSSRKTFLDTQAAALIAEANWIYAKGETLEYEN